MGNIRICSGGVTLSFFIFLSAPNKIRWLRWDKVCPSLRNDEWACQLFAWHSYGLLEAPCAESLTTPVNSLFGFVQLMAVPNCCPLAAFLVSA